MCVTISIYSQIYTYRARESERGSKVKFCEVISLSIAFLAG